MCGEVTNRHRLGRTSHGCPVKMSKSIPEYTTAPLLGQHNEEIYAEWMGYSKEEVARLKEEGVI